MPKKNIDGPYWDRFTMWLSKKTDKALLSWKVWFEKDNIPCEIRRQDNQYALFVYQEWSRYKYSPWAKGT